LQSGHDVARRVPEWRNEAVLARDEVGGRPLDRQRRCKVTVEARVAICAGSLTKKHVVVMATLQ